MSFALEYRKRLLAQRREQEAPNSAGSDPFSGLESETEETPRNRLKVLCALVVTTLILATFNSGALVYYARGLADGPLGPELLEISEGWHSIMESGRATRLVETVRAHVAGARETSWQDLGGGLGFGRTAATAAPTGVAATDRDTITSSLPADAQRVRPVRP
ncbi:MAG: hypothetical protein ACR2PO_01115 [Methyloligellaceae bacterium]